MPHTIRTIAKHAVAEMIIHLLEEITKLPERCTRIHCMFRNLLKGGSLAFLTYTTRLRIASKQQ
jgi:hypothetical protein